MCVCVCVCVCVCMRSLSGIPWTRAHKAPLSVEFFRQEYWSGLPFPSPGNLPNLGIESASPAYIYTRIEDAITIYDESHGLGLDYLGKYVDWLKKRKDLRTKIGGGGAQSQTLRVGEEKGE